MAKYKLRNSNNTVNCEILNESAGDYIVRFKNGVIQNVPKYRVSQLDNIDEGVLDTVRDTVSKYGRKFISKVKDVAQNIKNFIVNVFFDNGYIFFKDQDGEILPAVSPINSMIFAQSGKCELNFYPGSELRNTCDVIGIDSEASQNYRFRGEYEGFLGFDDNVNESVNTNNSVFSQIFEAASKDPINTASPWLAEQNKVKLYYESALGRIESVNADWITNAIIGEYEQRLKSTIEDEYKCSPLLIFGAPGVGKSEILNKINDKINEKFGQDATVMSLCCGGIGPHDLTMPAKIEDNGNNDIPKNYTLRDLEARTKGNTAKMKDKRKGFRKLRTVISDLPKTWLPVYQDNEDAEYLNVIANNGNVKPVADDGDDVQIIDEGSGGIFFMDEFTRLKQTGMDALMNTPISRVLGNSGLKFGTKWVIVAAGNRSTDMSQTGRKDLMNWEAASDTRFIFVNFVPNPEDWLNWAKSPRKGNFGGVDETGYKSGQKGKPIPNVIEPITSYVNFSLTTVGKNANATTGEGSFGDYYEVWNHTKIEGMGLNQTQDLLSPSGDLGKACPRSWEALSELLCRLYINNGVDLTQLTFENLVSECTKIIGRNPATRFATFISSRDVFTPQDADNAWEDIPAKFEIFEKIKALGQTEKFNMFKEKVLPVLINNCPQDNTQLFSNDYIKNILKFIHKYSSDGVNFDVHLFNLCEKALLDILAEKYGVSYRDPQGRWNAAKDYSAKIKANNATRL